MWYNEIYSLVFFLKHFDLYLEPPFNRVPAGTHLTGGSNQIGINSACINQAEARLSPGLMRCLFLMAKPIMEMKR
jgi:hypothetical protein